MPTADDAPRPRRRWLSASRTLVEAAVLVAAVAGFATLRHRGEFPRPLIRALRHGTPAERNEALRALSLFGPAGGAAIPALMETLRDDPDPAHRRGAAFALAAIVAPPSDEPFTLDAFLAGMETPGWRSDDPLRLAEPLPPPPPPRARAAEVSRGLIVAMQQDPGPTVRRQAFLALAELLDAATGTQPPRDYRPLDRDREPVEPRMPDDRRVEPWMTAAATAIAALAARPDPADYRPAATWLSSYPAARILLDESERLEALVTAARSAIRDGQPGYWERQLVKRTAAEVRRNPAARRRLLDALAGAMSGPEIESAAVGSEDLAFPYFVAGPTPEDLDDHPEAIAALARRLGGAEPPPESPYAGGYSLRDDPLSQIVFYAGQRANAAEKVQDYLFTDGVMLTIRDHPAILDRLAVRLDEPGWRALLEAPWGWEDVRATLLDPAAAPGLPPDRAAQLAERLLRIEAGLPEPGEPPAGSSYRPPDPRNNALAVVAYYLRAIESRSDLCRTYRDRVARLLDDDEIQVRELGERLAGAVPGATRP